MLEREGVRWVLLTGEVEDRVLEAREHYPDEAGFHDEVRRRGRRVLYVDERSASDVSGPWVALYRL